MNVSRSNPFGPITRGTTPSRKATPAKPTQPSSGGSTPAKRGNPFGPVTRQTPSYPKGPGPQPEAPTPKKPGLPPAKERFSWLGE